MMSENASNRRRKALSAVLAVAMATTMLLSGTLAYFYRSSVANTFSNADKDVVGHDDFVLVKKNSSTQYNSLYNKDIYVENVGGTSVFVRVKLTESFTLDGVTQVSSVPHIPTTKTEAGVTTTDLSVHQTTEGSGDEIHQYFTWDMGETSDASRKYYLSADSAKYNVDEGLTLNEDRIAQDTTQNKYQAEADAGAVATGEIKKLEVCPVISMTEYLSYAPETQKRFKGWVIDDTKKDAADTADADGNGWAYWSQRLMKGQTTGLLLNGVTVSKALDNRSYMYNIDVDFEAVNKDDQGLWRGTTTTGVSGEKYEGDNAVEKVSKEAAALLDNAASAMSEETLAVVEDLSVKAEATTSEGAASVYEEAIKQVVDKSKLNPDGEFAKERVETYTKIADDIAKRKASGDETLNVVVLGVEVDDNGKVTQIATTGENAGKITDMDIYLAQYLIDNFDRDHNHTITEEEALAVTDVEINRYPLGQYIADNRMTRLDGLTKDNFINLQRVSVILMSNITTLNADNFLRHDEKGNAIDGIYKLEIQNCYQLQGDFDVSKLKDYLRDFWFLECNENCGIKGIETLKNLRNLYLSIDKDKLKNCKGALCSWTEFNQMLAASSNMEFMFIKKINLLDAAGKESNDLSTMRLTKSLFQLTIKGMSGTLDLRNHTELQSISFGGKSATEKLVVTLPNQSAIYSSTIDEATVDVSYAEPEPSAS